MKLSILIILFFITSCSQNPTKGECAVVSKIGACDRHGYCGVMFTNGKIDYDVKQPVIGGTYCKIITDDRYYWHLKKE